MLQPYAAGSLSSIASSAWGGGVTKTEGFSAENNWSYGAKTITHAGLGAGTGDVGMIAFGTVVGGGSAMLTGGNFWQGAVTGLSVSLLNHSFHDNEIDPPGKKARNAVRKETVKPSFSKFVEVEGNTLGVVELARDSKMAQFVRGGAPKAASISKVLKVGGTALGVAGIGFELSDTLQGNMSWTEFGVDTLIGGAAILTTGVAAPYVAAGALIYFGGKAIYEYSSGNTLFTKPK